MEFEGQTPAYMELAKILFVLRSPEQRDNVELRNKLMAGIVAGNMAPYYIEVCTDLGWMIDKTLLSKMEEANTAQLAQYDHDMEVGATLDDDAPKTWYEKLLYLCSIGDKDAAVLLATAKSQDKILSLNRRLDATFALFRVAYFHGCDVRAMSRAIDQATAMIDSSGSGGDWSARNKLKAYEALCCLALRDYTKAAPLFLDAIPTFESTELATFESFFRYALVAAMIALPRGELHERLMKPGLIPQAMHAHASELKDYFTSLHKCHYAAFFRSLASVEVFMKSDPVLQPHYRHYVREMKLRAFSQMLCAYRSLSLKSMAEAFGVSEDLIEQEVARFAAAGRLQCKIDHVGRCVITGNHTTDDKMDNGLATNPSINHNRASLYQGVIKKGDNLLNRLKNLTRVLEV